MIHLNKLNARKYDNFEVNDRKIQNTLSTGFSEIPTDCFLRSLVIMCLTSYDKFFISVQTITNNNNR